MSDDNLLMAIDQYCQCFIIWSSPALSLIWSPKALNYGVPPVIVDSTPPPDPHGHGHHHGGHGVGTLKTGYFPPETRVMPRVSRKDLLLTQEFR